MERIWTIIDIIKWATDFFNTKGVESPRLNIELMLDSLLGMQRIQLYTNFEKPLSQAELDKLHEWIVRRARREPLQYILGTAQFLDYELYVDESVLIPRPETELLAHHAIELIKSEKYNRILDIGTGSGCIAIAIAKGCPDSEVTAIDVSNNALKTARKNIDLHNCNNIELRKIDILSENLDEKYDLIVSNPPYIPKKELDGLEKDVRDYEPQIALTDNGDGLAFYRKFSDIFSNLLNKDGKFLLEIEAGTEEIIAGIFRKYNNINYLNDLGNMKRIISAENINY